MISLVGYTGFVGSNIYEAAGSGIDCVYNSENIESAYGTSPDLLIYAGLRAEKYLANNSPDKDMELILAAKENIDRINPKSLVLISTIDVFKNPKGVDEDSPIDTMDLHPYGYNRYKLEHLVRKDYPDALIIRLPGLFGKNIKKNLIYDYINVIPFMLREDKFMELSGKDDSLKNYYELQDNGFYRLNCRESDRSRLKDSFNSLGFSALNFTDTRSRYQFYNLNRLWSHINILLDKGIKLWHAATEPVSAGEVVEYLSGRAFCNELVGTPADYDFRTKVSHLFGGKDGYIASKDEVLSDIRSLVLTLQGESIL